MIYQRAVCICLLLVVLFFVPGCAGLIDAVFSGLVRIIVWIFCILLALFFVIGLFGAAISSGETQRRPRQSQNEHINKLREAAKRYDETQESFNEARNLLEDWMPECREIGFREAQRNSAAYNEGSTMLKAREKSLRMINAASELNTILSDGDIRLDFYRAEIEIGRLFAACSACKEENFGKSSFRCVALEEARRGTTDSDLVFRRKEHGEE